jgi:hypothetical protein
MAVQINTSDGRNEIHLVIDKPPKESGMSPTLQKIIRIAAISLISLGICLFVGGSLCTGLGALAILPAASIAGAMACGPALLTLAVTSVYSGCHLLYNAEKRSFSKIHLTKLGGGQILN